MRNIFKTICLVMAMLGAFCLTVYAQDNVIESKTHFSEDVLKPYVESGQLPGAISVFYKDGVQE